ncbi:hypothetical protein FB192DRAFT_1448605 [Mucor lusitanicus]|uniref:Uncharacterized protein n=2 Tax=Mucor circinelloides f. lusitanicus TaxID=29924 RepID=A0A168IXU4_MUCCL|nr:hypothetical protein FB192DRAFT_1448605 [Mucor lusitanicus]OAD00492.1 hypothetical protein MUCCIDRAFT_85900 [Mucor lusitanicus CBS 277.49]OAD00493.1 hypothetical protein MUCCIDRAFT_166274 [Mucor lusitanicus CBS 277.49]
MPLDNQHRLLSEFFKIAATAIQQSSPLTQSSLTSLVQKLDISDNKIPVIDELAEQLQGDPKGVDALGFFSQHHEINELTQEMSAQISTTNKKVASFVEAQFQKLFV